MQSIHKPCLMLYCLVHMYVDHLLIICRLYSLVVGYTHGQKSWDTPHSLTLFSSFLIRFLDLLNTHQISSLCKMVSRSKAEHWGLKQNRSECSVLQDLTLTVLMEQRVFRWTCVLSGLRWTGTQRMSYWRRWTTAVYQQQANRSSWLKSLRPSTSLPLRVCAGPPTLLLQPDTQHTCYHLLYNLYSTLIYIRVFHKAVPSNRTYWHICSLLTSLSITKSLSI